MRTIGTSSLTVNIYSWFSSPQQVQDSKLSWTHGGSAAMNGGPASAQPLHHHHHHPWQSTLTTSSTAADLQGPKDLDEEQLPPSATANNIGSSSEAAAVGAGGPLNGAVSGIEGARLYYTEQRRPQIQGLQQSKTGPRKKEAKLTLTLKKILGRSGGGSGQETEEFQYYEAAAGPGQQRMLSRQPLPSNEHQMIQQHYQTVSKSSNPFSLPAYDNNQLQQFADR